MSVSIVPSQNSGRVSISLPLITYTPASTLSLSSFSAERISLSSSESSGAVVSGSVGGGSGCLSFSSSSFTHCDAAMYGGAVSLSAEGELNSTNLVFSQTTFTDGSITVQPSSDASVTKLVNSISDDIFVCSATSVTFTSISFSLTGVANPVALSSSLFSATTGSLTLTHIILTPSSLATISSPLITITSSADAEIDGCTFSNVSLTSDGISATLGGGHILSITGDASTRSSFTHSHSNTGNGGAICVRMEGDESKLLISGGGISESKTLFSECSASIGGGLYINVEGSDCVLEVKNSVFTDCTCTSDSGKGVASVTISSISFELHLSPIAPSTDTSILIQAQDNGSVTLTDIVITGDDTSLTSSLIGTSEGQLVLQNVQFSTIPLNDAPLHCNFYIRFFHHQL